MLKIYGSMLCPDCVDCCADLDNTNIPYEFLDFADSVKNLKEFLVITELLKNLIKCMTLYRLSICLLEWERDICKQII